MKIWFENKYKIDRISKEMEKNILTEINILKKGDHPNVLKFIDIKTTDNNIYLITKSGNGGDLARLLKVRGNRLEDREVKYIIKQVALGIEYLNSKKGIHRDIKLENIMLNFPHYSKHRKVKTKFLETCDLENEEVEVIIIDLGLSK